MSRTLTSNSRAPLRPLPAAVKMNISTHARGTSRRAVQLPFRQRILPMTGTATPITPPPQANPDHDARGCFAEGNKGGPGNPFARKTAALRRAMLDAVSDQDMAEVTAAVLGKAKGGDLGAAKLLYQYTVGRPRPAQDPDRLDAHEMHTY